jgi:UDP:flavonoid glycosyltransferase YjiC (YdhE family)
MRSGPRALVTHRIVLACWGSYGDLFPYLALAARLRERGLEPVVATAPYYRDLVERAGFACHPMRPDLDPFNTALIARVMDPARGGAVVIGEVTAPAVRDAYDDLVPIVRTADLVISHPITFAAPIAAAAQGVPWLSTVLAPTSFFSVCDFPVLPPLPPVVQIWRSTPWAARAFFALARRITRPWTAPVRALRAELHLPDTGEPLYEGQFSPHGTLAMFSTVLAAPQADWPPTTRVTGFAFHDDTAPTPVEVDRFLDAGEPPIVFTLGTSAAGAAGSFYRESLEAARALGRRALLLVGRQEGAFLAQPLPPGLLAAEYAPHHIVFARAAAIVHHGGIGTTARALASGRPMLVVPHAHDQPDNAHRVEGLGVARVLDARRYRARRAARHLDALLTDSRYRDAADRARQVIAAEDGPGAACDAIARVLQLVPAGVRRPGRSA